MANGKIFCAITPHGFGHAAIACEVLNALAQTRPGLGITINGNLPKAWLSSRLNTKFHHVPEGSDFGLYMHNATSVRREATALAYRTQWQNWKAVMREEKARLRNARAEAVLACASFQTLAAAQDLGMPTFTLGPFHWADIIDHYFPSADAESANIFPEDLRRFMRQTYKNCDAILATQPHLPMLDIPRLYSLSTIAHKPSGENQDHRQKFRKLVQEKEAGRLNMYKEDVKWALIAFGGMSPGINIEKWPEVPGWRYLVPVDDAMLKTSKAWPRHLMAWPMYSEDLSFSQVLGAVDVAITKPGYGIFTEAGQLGIPVITQSREDWPETKGLLSWLSDRVPYRVVDEQAMSKGNLGTHLRGIIREHAKSQNAALPEIAPSDEDGALSAAMIIHSKMRQRSLWA